MYARGPEAKYQKKKLPSTSREDDGIEEHYRIGDPLTHSFADRQRVLA